MGRAMEEERRDAFPGSLYKIGGYMTWENKLENFEERLEEVFLFIKKKPGLFFLTLSPLQKLRARY